MSRNQTATVTFAVRLTLPKNGNAASAQQYIRDAISSHRGGKSPDDPYFDIQPDMFTVRLVKKEVVYG